MLAKRLKVAMESASLTQADLARACNVKPPSISGWLSGKSKFLKGENLLLAADALNVSRKWLATGEGDMRQETAIKPHSSKSWSPADDPDYLPKIARDREAAGKIPGYSTEALALAWLLDQVKDKLDKKKAEVHASAIILDYINQPDVQPKRMPDTH